MIWSQLKQLGLYNPLEIPCFPHNCYSFSFSCTYEVLIPNVSEGERVRNALDEGEKEPARKNKRPPCCLHFENLQSREAVPTGGATPSGSTWWDTRRGKLSVKNVWWILRTLLNHSPHCKFLAPLLRLPPRGAANHTDTFLEASAKSPVNKDTFCLY